MFNSAEVYDPATSKWNATASLNTARAGHTATLLNNGTVMVVGGADRSAELYSAINQSGNYADVAPDSVFFPFIEKLSAAGIL